MSRRAGALVALGLLAVLGVMVALVLLHRSGAAPARLARPVSVQRSLSRLDPRFGDTVVASANVVVDARLVDPRTVALQTSFAPYHVASSTRSIRHEGRTAVVHVESRLRCLDVACVPAGDRKTVRFRPLRVTYREGAAVRTLSVAWPAVTVHSRVTAADLLRPVLRVPRPQPASSDYRLPPRPTGFALLGLAALLALVGGALLVRLGASVARSVPRRTVPRLERVLRELAAAASGGDAARRRRALEQLAQELEHVHAPLSAESRVLAWGPRDPRPPAISDLTSRVRAAVTP